MNSFSILAFFCFKKLYTEDWEGDKTLFYPYNDSPELRRVAQAQKALSDVSIKAWLKIGFCYSVTWEASGWTL